jgi:hypothetical protein
VISVPVDATCDGCGITVKASVPLSWSWPAGSSNVAAGRRLDFGEPVLPPGWVRDLSGERCKACKEVAKGRGRG